MVICEMVKGRITGMQPEIGEMRHTGQRAGPVE